MLNQFSRTELLLGQEAVERLASARVAVFGLGGVGGCAAEALVRSGLGAIDLVDDDKLCLTNLNRQIFALHSTVGQYKADAAAARLLDINPDLRLCCHRVFYGPDTAAQFDFSQYDYVVDAIDTVTGKLALVMQARDSGVPIISAMGAGNKLDPTAFRVADIYETAVCPLARVMRRELRRRGVDRLKVVYSREEPRAPAYDGAESCRTGCVCPPGSARLCSQRRQVPGSSAFVPPVMGLIIAAEVVKDLTGA